MKGIILAGGSGTRMYPMTKSVSKQMLPIYDKPMIYYPLTVLMLFDIKDILIISTPEDTPVITKLLGSGAEWGLNLQYKVQPSPDGLAQAFTLGKEFIGGEPVIMILGDNLLYTSSFKDIVAETKANAVKNLATIFGYRVPDPERFGVIEFDRDKNVLSVEEKPKQPKSDYAAIGLYCYPGDVSEKAAQVKPSARGEMEITDLSDAYLKEGRLKAISLGRGTTWLDAGTPDSLMDAALFVQITERRQSIKIACPEEVALRKGLIATDAVNKKIDSLKKGAYAEYLKKVVKEVSECNSSKQQ